MEHIYQRRVSFADTDAAGVVHFSRLLCYAEEAEHDLLTELGIPILKDGGWPRVQVSCDYLAPVHFGDEVQVKISPVKIGNSSVSWRFALSKDDKELAKGEMTTVRVDKNGKPEALRVEEASSLFKYQGES